jgi:hypothetical protein
VGTSSHTDSVPPYLTDLLLGSSFAQVCFAKMSSSEFVILDVFILTLQRAILSAGISSHTDSVPLYLTEKLSPTRRRGGGAAAGAPTADCRRLPPTLRRPPPTWRRPPPTAADRRRPSGLAPTAHVWRRPAPNGRQMRRSACAERPPNLAPNIRRIGAEIAASGRHDPLSSSFSWIKRS